LALPVGDGEILYIEPIYSQRSQQESAYPKLLRVLVSYKGRVGYAPSVSEALQQVGIDPKAAQEIEVVPGDGSDAPEDAAQDQAAPEDDSPAADDSSQESATPAPAASQDEAVQAINDALRGLEEARDGTNEEYGRALDELDAAVRAYQDL
jgi:uncharacterized membrane protein (UPF0182 family)